MTNANSYTRLLLSQFSNRSRFSIMAEILQLAKTRASKTQILYGGNLSFAQLNSYLELLIQLSLLTVISESKRRFYQTTCKGLKFLKCSEEIMKLLNVT